MGNLKPVDTIAAIATAPGRGGIGVVRVSGPHLQALAEQILGRPPAPRQAVLSRFRDARGEAIDCGIALFYPAPHSYTGEDVLELQGHGGPVVMQLLLERCLELGARLAQPGEFTRRAFLNDKLDLAQAESVADLIDASTTAAARSALRSLSGDFSRAVHGVVDDLVDLRMRVEATLDFPEEDVGLLREMDADSRLHRVTSEVEAIMARARQGSLLRTGLQVVLAGQPNVGKSSLLNRLAGEERAIVTAIAGTTRDAVREVIQIEGIPLHIIDTAGLRQAADEVERIGIERAWREIERADAVLLVADARHGVTAEDEAIAAQLPRSVERLMVFNKADLAQQPASRREVAGAVTLTLSAKTGQGIGMLHDELLRIIGWQSGAEDVFMARERHLEALAQALGHLEAARRVVARAELFAEELRLAQAALGGITGEFTADDLLGEIFSRFCIGK